MGGKNTTHFILCCCSLTAGNICSMRNTQCWAANTTADRLDTMAFRRLAIYPSLPQPHKEFDGFQAYIFCSQQEGILGRWHISLGFAGGRNEFKSKLGSDGNELPDFSSVGFLLTIGYDNLQLRSLARCYSCPSLSSCRQCRQYLDFLF